MPLTPSLLDEPRSATNDPEPFGLSLVTDRRPDGLHVSLVGRLDRSGAALLVGCVRAWANDGVRDVVVHLGGVTTTDGLGLRGLLHARRVMRARAGSLTVVAAGPDVHQTLVRAGLAVPAARASP